MIKLSKRHLLKNYSIIVADVLFHVILCDIVRPLDLMAIYTNFWYIPQTPLVGPLLLTLKQIKAILKQFFLMYSLNDGQSFDVQINLFI